VHLNSEEDKMAYNMAKLDTNKAVAKAKEAESERFSDMLNWEEGCKMWWYVKKWLEIILYCVQRATNWYTKDAASLKEGLEQM